MAGINLYKSSIDGVFDHFYFPYIYTYYMHHGLICMHYMECIYVHTMYVTNY